MSCFSSSFSQTCFVLKCAFDKWWKLNLFDLFLLIQFTNRVCNFIFGFKVNQLSSSELRNFFCLIMKWKLFITNRDSRAGTMGSHEKKQKSSAKTVFIKPVYWTGLLDRKAFFAHRYYENLTDSLKVFKKFFDWLLLSLGGYKIFSLNILPDGTWCSF